MVLNKLLILLLPCLVLLFSSPCNSQTALNSNTIQHPLTVGAERIGLYLRHLKGQRVGVVVNQSSMAFEQHLVDFLRTQAITVTAIFAPEHGFRGDHGAGQNVSSKKDPVTGLPIYSLYGKNRKPSPEMLEQVDVLVFDIQDVGVRFYTYISTLHYVMEAAAKYDKSIIVLDRPNPNIMYVDGPILEPEFQSFVGLHPIPILHGMTVAEIAQMIKGEAWIDNAEQLSLITVPIDAYHRNASYSLPIAPSPNLANDIAIRLYPSLCFFEPTVVSIGRGTDFPFQVMGHDSVRLGEFSFTPVSMPQSAPEPKLKNRLLMGIDLRDSPTQGLDLSLLFSTYAKFNHNNVPFFLSESFFDRLAGNASLRQALQQGQSFTEVQQSWQTSLNAFKIKRMPYLIYPTDLK